MPDKVVDGEITLWDGALHIHGLTADEAPPTWSQLLATDEAMAALQGTFEMLKLAALAGELELLPRSAEYDEALRDFVSTFPRDDAVEWRTRRSTVISWANSKGVPITPRQSPRQDTPPSSASTPRSLSRAAIKRHFPRYNAERWESLFRHEHNNGLAAARARGRSKAAMYDAQRLAEWLINRGDYTISETNRILAGGEEVTAADASRGYAQLHLAGRRK